MYIHTAGFLIDDESIDVTEQNDPNHKYVPSQTIDVYSKGWAHEPDIIYANGEHIVRIDNEPIWQVLQPYIPKITQIVIDNRNKEKFQEFYPNEPNRQPELHWVFFRKYSPNDERNSLKHHIDTNMNTVNIELSNDYEGGGIFYIKQFASNNSIAEEYYNEKKGYDWLDTLKRENTTDIIFPDLHAGDAIFYNYTVRHGVAPCVSGIRVSHNCLILMNECYEILDLILDMCFTLCSIQWLSSLIWTIQRFSWNTIQTLMNTLTQMSSAMRE